MTIDLRKDAAALRAMLERCVMRYSAGARSGVGRPFHPPLTRLDIVFTLGDGTSTPLIYLRLDTKPRSEPDGDPTHPLFDVIEHPEWGAAVRYLVETDGNKWPVILPDGKPVLCDIEEFTQRVGDLFVDAFKSARDQGVFGKLPKAERCEFGVEAFGGGFGWPRYEDRGTENLA